MKPFLCIFKLQSIAEIYNPTKNMWSAFIDTKIVRKNFGVVLVNEIFIVVGGHNDQNTLNQVSLYILLL